MRDRVSYILFIVVIIMIIGVSYAYFSSTLVINGVSKLNGSFEVIYSNAYIDNQSDLEDISISSDGLSLTFSVSLAMPGESDTINYTITNNGSIDALLDDLVVTSSSDSDVIFDCSSISGELLSGNSVSGTIIVTWVSDSYSAKKDVSFNAYIKASQKI